MYRKIFILTAFAFYTLTSVSIAAPKPEFEISIENHRFNPEVVEIPAHQKVKLIVHNLDSTPEEFESYSLNREKVITGKGKAVIFVGPLKPGDYDFFGEFNPKTANGIIRAVEA